MKQLGYLTTFFCAYVALSITVLGGPEPVPSGKEMKEVAPVAPPPGCDWSGFYVGINAGGQFGHSEDKDLMNWYFPDRPWGYHESGFVAGGQVGYNYQWKWLVIGPEFDLGYMNLDGRGVEAGTVNPKFVQPPAYGNSDSDFYTTLRGRVGVALNSWLFYATGGGIGVNYDTRYTDKVFAHNEPFFFDAHEQDFDWGYTVGGGVERKLGCHWSIKVEYLYYTLGTQTFGGKDPISGSTTFGDTYHFDAETAGHIVRAGLNFHF